VARYFQGFEYASEEYAGGNKVNHYEILFKLIVPNGWICTVLFGSLAVVKASETWLGVGGVWWDLAHLAVGVLVFGVNLIVIYVKEPLVRGLVASLIKKRRVD
jgi:hypothetical protein